jgi:Zn-dependent protease
MLWYHGSILSERAYVTVDSYATPDPERSELAWLRAQVEPHMRISDVTIGALDGRAIRLRGVLLTPSDQLYALLAPALRQRGRTLLLREEEGEIALLALKGVVQPKANNRWLPIVLATLTFVSMVFTYAIMHIAGESITWPAIMAGMGDALAFTVSLLAILVTHEFGHYLVARRFGVAVSLPFLIPMPLSLLGTMGAIIQMKELPPSRKAMLYIGAAGPLAGLVVGIPILALGIALSEVTTLPTDSGYMMEGNSLLYAGLKYIIKGEWLPSGARDIMLHPVALAGWAGVLITSFNLIPAGQLDGGHVATALLGRHARNLTWAVIVLLLLLGFMWQGWLIWAVMVFVFSRARVEPMDNVTRLTPSQMRLAALLLLLAVLTFTPIPIRLF